MTEVFILDLATQANVKKFKTPAAMPGFLFWINSLPSSFRACDERARNDENAPQSTYQIAPAPPLPLLRDLENEIRPVTGQFAGKQSLALDASDLGHGALRAPVLIADPEHDGVDKRKGVVEHQALHFAVAATTPMAAGEKRPADLDLTQLRLIAIIAARARQLAGRTVDEQKTRFRSDPTVQKFSKTPPG